jgi:hypothetical protein
LSETSESGKPNTLIISLERGKKGREERGEGRGERGEGIGERREERREGRGEGYVDSPKIWRNFRFHECSWATWS